MPYLIHPPLPQTFLSDLADPPSVESPIAFDVHLQRDVYPDSDLDVVAPQAHRRRLGSQPEFVSAVGQVGAKSASARTKSVQTEALVVP